MVGFYLQPAVGGRVLDAAFWRAFLDIERVVAIKVAPFNRYRTLDVVRGARRERPHGRRALHRQRRCHRRGPGDAVPVSGSGDRRCDSAAGCSASGRSGRNAPSTLLEQCLAVTEGRLASAGDEVQRLLALGAELTDLNAALFDPAHDFAGCIPGIHEVLRRQGLLAGRWCLDPHEELSPGQMEEIDRVLARYPHLMDDEFIAARLDAWLA